jgi:hypothetical protein
VVRESAWTPPSPVIVPRNLGTFITRSGADLHYIGAKTGGFGAQVFPYAVFPASWFGIRWKGRAAVLDQELGAEGGGCLRCQFRDKVDRCNLARFVGTNPVNARPVMTHRQTI